MNKEVLPVRVWLIGLALAAITVAAFAPVARHPLIYLDDVHYVGELNPVVEKGLTWEGIKWAFTTGEMANYHPITWLSHMLDRQMFGPAWKGGNAWGHHAVNVVFHVANVLLLFWLLRGATGAVWRSAVVAALFAVHPLRVESVAWVAERKDVLSTFFGLLCLLAYVRYARGGGWSYYVMSLLWLALGLLSKPMLVTWPAVMVLLDFWPLGRAKPGTATRIIVEKLPMLAMVIASSVVTYLAQYGSGAVKSLERLPLLERVSNVLSAYLMYIVKWFWPVDLAVLYPYPRHPQVGLAVAGLAVVLLFTGLAVWRRGYLATGWFWYLGTLVPVIGLVQVGAQSMADRYTYVPGIGLAIVAVWGISEVAERLVADPYKRRAALGIGVGVVVAACVGVTWFQLRFWSDPMKLFARALAVTEGNYTVHRYMGEVLMRSGDTDGAMKQFREALRIYDRDSLAAGNLGMLLLKRSRFEEAHGQGEAAGADLSEAERYIAQARQIRQDQIAVAANLATIRRLQHRYDHAMTLYKEIGEADRFIGLKGQGATLVDKGEYERAYAMLEEALKMQPKDAGASFDMGRCLLRMGRAREAEDYLSYARAVSESLNSWDPEPHLVYAEALVKLGKARDAVLICNQLLKGNDKLVRVWRYRGDFLEAMGEPVKAAESYRKGLAVEPGNAELKAALERVSGRPGGTP